VDTPTQEQVAAAVKLIDEHLATCTEDPCPGIEKELAAIHPSFSEMAESMIEPEIKNRDYDDYSGALKELQAQDAIE